MGERCIYANTLYACDDEICYRLENEEVCYGRFGVPKRHLREHAEWESRNFPEFDAHWRDGIYTVPCFCFVVPDHVNPESLREPPFRVVCYCDSREYVERMKSKCKCLGR